MTTFALITEGITDQIMIEYILNGLIKDEVFINPIHPPRDANNDCKVAKGKFSNWESVIQFLKSQEILTAIQNTNSDFVVIQIDTDMGEHKNFGLDLHDENRKYKPILTIVEECIEKLKQSLPSNFPRDKLGKLLFAIPVLSTECWILSLRHFINKNKGYEHNNDTIKNCEDDLTQFLERQDSSFEKKCEVFKVLCKDFRKRKNIESVAQRTPCLQHFVNQVNAACPSF